MSGVCKDAGVVQLVPELVSMLPLDAHLVRMGRSALPRLLWWTCACLNALDLRTQLPPLQYAALAVLCVVAGLHPVFSIADMVTPLGVHLPPNP